MLLNVDFLLFSRSHQLLRKLELDLQRNDHAFYYFVSSDAKNANNVLANNDKLLLKI